MISSMFVLRYVLAEGLLEQRVVSNHRGESA
jgi:hypothetical protein